jgi:hypothetical protein
MMLPFMGRLPVSSQILAINRPVRLRNAEGINPEAGGKHKTGSGRVAGSVRVGGQWTPRFSGVTDRVVEERCEHADGQNLVYRAVACN